VLSSQKLAQNYVFSPREPPGAVSLITLFGDLGAITVSHPFNALAQPLIKNLQVVSA